MRFWDRITALVGDVLTEVVDGLSAPPLPPRTFPRGWYGDQLLSDAERAEKWRCHAERQRHEARDESEAGSGMRKRCSATSRVSHASPCTFRRETAEHRAWRACSPPSLTPIPRRWPGSGCSPRTGRIESQTQREETETLMTTDERAAAYIRELEDKI